jgi:hypothetical protein
MKLLGEQTDAHAHVTKNRSNLMKETNLSTTKGNSLCHAVHTWFRENPPVNIK